MSEQLETPGEAPPERRIYCNRTLNLKSIGAIGYDMDYTLIHYRFEAWERRAYDFIRELFAEEGWPVAGLEFDQELVTRGLILDTELGNIVKANRFGFVMRATHGTAAMSFEDQRKAYRHLPINLSESRFFFLNTLFALSGSCLFAQLVDLYDQHAFPDVHGYRDLFERIVGHLDQTHVEGTLKAEIINDPKTFVEVDPDAPLALLDQLRSGKRLMLISNAEWGYVQKMMAFAYDPYLPDEMTWRDLFELVIVGARKPDFFSAQLPLFSVADEDRGLFEPEPLGIQKPGLYLGGDASCVEEYLGLSGSEILYVGDHVFADVRMSKSILRWRTALILRELEDEVSAIQDFRPQEAELGALMAQKRTMEKEHSRMRLRLQRREKAYGPTTAGSSEDLPGRMAALKDRIMRLDEQIAPLAKRAAEVDNPRWGLLLRAGNDKSHLARQVEASADIYTSRVSNFLFATPFAYLRSVRGNMPHDP